MKLCNRDYSEGSLLATKQINGIACCTNCDKPTICHNKPVEQRAMFWALSGDTGISSESICAHMTGNPKNDHFGIQPPSDAADRGRCIRLLELIPEWIERLPEMKQYDANARESIVIGSSGITAERNTWAEQIPKIMAEGRL